MKNKIYLLRGTSGRYPGDWLSWTVGAFETHDMAEQYLKSILEVNLYLKKVYPRLVENPGLNPYDPQMQFVDDADPEYKIEEILLHASIKKLEVSQIVKGAQHAAATLFRTKPWFCQKRNLGFHKKPDLGCGCENCELFEKSLRTTPH